MIGKNSVGHAATLFIAFLLLTKKINQNLIKSVILPTYKTSLPVRDMIGLIPKYYGQMT